MIETLLFFLAVLAASVVVMWCERNRLERQIASLLEEIAAERSTVSRQMIELAEIKADKIRDEEQLTSLQKERDHARKLMDETRERCVAEMDVLEDTIRDLGREKNMAEKRINQLLVENKRQAISDKNLRQSRQKIINHCRMLKRKQKKLIEFYDYVLEELTAIHTYR